MKAQSKPYVSTTNACKLCTPLGACLAFKGIEGAVPFLHGSQGCATYMRRYIISHYREPMDIASSSLGEKHAIYGGGPNLKLGLKNVMTKYRGELIGVATTCLTETIGDDVALFLSEFRRDLSHLPNADGHPGLVHVSTPSYSGTHMEGFHGATRAVVDQLAENGASCDRINLMPGFVSPADIRYLKEIIADFGFKATILPDISLTLDGPAVDRYERIPRGGTPLSQIRKMGGSPASIEFGATITEDLSAGAVLEQKFSVPCHRMGMPIGLRASDSFFHTLESLVGAQTPEKHLLERGRLLDAYVDAHKYVFGRKAVVYGEEDLVVGLTAFLAEIGIHPVLCASGGNSGRLSAAIQEVTEGILDDPPRVRDNVDFHEINERAVELDPDLVIGNSKGYRMARDMGIPLIRAGFPIHDRFGGPRILHVGYRGALSLLDSIVNTVIDARQQSSEIGYTYY